MPRRHTRRLLAVALAEVVLLVGAAPAKAHSASFFEIFWSASVQTAGVWIYAKSGSGGLTANEANRLVDARNQWNSAPPTIWFNYKGFTTETWGSCAAPRNRNVVFKGYIDGTPSVDNDLAFVQTCWEGVPTNFHSFYMQIENGGDSFYVGNGTPRPPGHPDGAQNDLWSVLSHELGHGVGWIDHYDDTARDPGDDACEGSSGWETMCKEIHIGTTDQRGLDLHDVHTFDAAY